MYSLQVDKFLLFGDSITEFSYGKELSFGLGPALSADYVRKLDVVNRGFAGYNTRWALKILPRILEQEKNILISTLFFGTNDACFTNNQSVPLDEFVANTRAMIKMFQERNIKLVVISPGFHDPKQWEAVKGEEALLARRTTERNRMYATALKELAVETGVAFVDTMKLFDKYATTSSNPLDELLSDGVHFTGASYKLLYDDILRVIGDNWPELLPETVRMVLPPWREVVLSEL